MRSIISLGRAFGLQRSWGRSDRLSSDRLAAGKHPPFSLRDGFGLRGRILETLRDLSNATITINPLVRGGLSRASIIFASTADTRNLLRGPLKKNAWLLTTGNPNGAIGLTAYAVSNTTKAALRWLASLLEGVHIAVRAFAMLLKKFQMRSSP